MLIPCLSAEKSRSDDTLIARHAELVSASPSDRGLRVKPAMTRYGQDKVDFFHQVPHGTIKISSLRDFAKNVRFAGLSSIKNHQSKIKN
jgi:hypothetical protein